MSDTKQPKKLRTGKKPTRIPLADLENIRGGQGAMVAIDGAMVAIDGAMVAIDGAMVAIDEDPRARA